MKNWELKPASRPLDQNRIEHTLSYRDPKTGLLLRCVAVEYRDFPTVEWTLYFKNPGTEATPILADIQALDVVLKQGPGAGQKTPEFHLHHNVGSICSARDYQPLETVLKAGASQRISAAGGRPTNSDLCYFNLEMPDREGLIMAIGWPGQWVAQFACDRQGRLRIRAGQELTHFKLLPGEEVRTPLIALQFWKGDRLDSQNVWRRWMMAHSMPKPGGRLPPPMLTASSSGAYGEMVHANEANQIMHIDRYCQERIPINFWWMDAGWYIQQHGWPQVGTWDPDPKRFPKGFKPISDHAHAKGLKILVWFEPERVAPGTYLADHHPEWVSGGKKGGLLDLGNPAAWKWLLEHVDNLITKQGIDIYRQDFNMDPLGDWRHHDTPDRQGITEIKHVTGLLAYWDELIRRHPNLLIDTCASGGRRIDLETLRRAVPLWRSDYAFEPVGHQGMTYGLSSWAPYHGTGTVAYVKASYYNQGRLPVEPYAFWSNSAPCLGLGIDIRVKDNDYPALRRLIQQRAKITPYYYGDFYPLTAYSLDNTAWIAWQFDGPVPGQGMVQAFRRAESPYESLHVKLRGLDPQASYTLTNLNLAGSTDMLGRDLLERGLTIPIQEQPGVATIVYKKKS